MTRNRWQEVPDAVLEAERLYKFVGEYVIVFQWLEGKIDEMFLLARGRESREETFGWLAQKTNAQKVDAFYEMIIADKPFRPVTLDGWSDRLISVRDRLHAERRRRNGILHAQFLFDFLTIGAPVVRTHVTQRNGNLIFEQDDLSPSRCDEIMRDLAQLAFDLNMLCVQLYHTFDPSELN
jgi:hypothetical protein